MRRLLVRIGLLGALASGVAVIASASEADVQPEHGVRFERLTQGGSRFLNYDGARNFRRRDRDWPIDFIFWHAASVDKVKAYFDEVGMDLIGGTMYEGYKYTPGSRRRFDNDRGKKSPCGSNTHQNEHVRIYGTRGSDRFFDRRYGFFVVGSSHIDHADGCGDPDTQWFGESELAEERVVDRLRDETPLIIGEDFITLNNQESRRIDALDARHFWFNDGKATTVRIPCDEEVCP